MSLVFNILQLAFGAFLITAVLLQQKGSGLGGAFGGSGEVFQTRRGVEKTLFIATIILSVIFLGLAITRIVLKI